MSDLKEKLKLLSQSDGTSGDEDRALTLLQKMLPDNFITERDINGNLLAELKGNGKTFLLDAHIDRIGLVVTSAEEGGFLRVAKCGGMDARVLAAQDVTIHGEKEIFGVIISTPPHLSTAEDSKKAKDFDELLVDTGLSCEELKKIAPPGTRITVNSPTVDLINNRIAGPAIDDRAGCIVIMKAAQIVAEQIEHPAIKLLFSSQEETGGTGAVTGAFKIDADECISVDVSFGNVPDSKPHEYAIVGKGPMIGFAPVLNYNMSKKLVKLAEEKNIPYQVEVMGGDTGTNADSIAASRCGIKTGLVSVPIENMHTGVEVVSMEDIEASAELIASYILGGEINA